MRGEISPDGREGPPASLGASVGRSVGPAFGPSVLRLACIVWTALAVWWLAIPSPAEFSFDDREAVVENPVVEGSLPAMEAFRRDYWHHIGDAGHYRPLATVALRVDRNLSGEEPDPRVFRRTNVFLHLGVCLIAGLAFLLLEARGRCAFPWFGLAVFALHPACADVAAWISGRTSSLSGIGAALGLLLLALASRTHGRFSFALWPAAGFIGAFTALLGKEDGLVIAAAAPPVAWALAGGGSSMSRWRAALPTALGAAAAVAAVAALRASALGSAMPAAPSAILAGEPLGERLLTGAGAWARGVADGLMPWSMLPPSLDPEDLGQRGAWAAGLTSALVVALILTRKSGAARLSLALVCLAILPLIQLVPAGEIFAPRFLYQPLLLGAPAISVVAAALVRPLGKRLGTSLLLLVLAALAASSVKLAAPVYDSRTTYWEAHLPAHQGDARVWNALGECSRETGDLDEAARRFEKSAELDPRYSRPLANLGALAMRRGDDEGAIRWLELAIFEGPREASPRGNLATVLLRLGQAEDAAEFYADAIRLSPGRATFHRGLARAELRAGRPAAARAALEAAEVLSPAHPSHEKLRAEISSAIAASSGTATER